LQKAGTLGEINIQQRQRSNGVVLHGLTIAGVAFDNKNRRKIGRGGEKKGLLGATAVKKRQGKESKRLSYRCLASTNRLF